MNMRVRSILFYHRLPDLSIKTRLFLENAKQFRLLTQRNLNFGISIVKTTLINFSLIEKTIRTHNLLRAENCEKSPRTLCAGRKHRPEDVRRHREMNEYNETLNSVVFMRKIRRFKLFSRENANYSEYPRMKELFSDSFSENL